MPLLDGLPKVPSRVRNRRLKDYSGTRFGRLTATSLRERDVTSENNHMWSFVCDCGREVDARIKNVRSGHTRSCGCLLSELTAERNRTHGLSKRPEYKAWKDMHARCRNPKRADYPDYGGRGISVCGRWAAFEIFHADMGPRPEGMTLDRMEVDGNYEPGNCRWANAHQQARNRRSNVRIVHDGSDKTVQEWANDLGMDRGTILWRLKQGWPISEVLDNRDRRLRS